MSSKNKKKGIERERYSKLAIWSLALALVNWIIPEFILDPFTDLFVSQFFWYFIFIWFAVPALSFILGVVALIKIKKNKSLKGKAIAIIGIVIASLFLLGSFFIGGL